MTPQIILMLGELPEWNPPGNVRTSLFQVKPAVGVYLALGSRRLCLSGRVYRTIGASIAEGDAFGEQSFVQRVRSNLISYISTYYGTHGHASVTYETIRELMEGFTTALHPTLPDSARDAGSAFADFYYPPRHTERRMPGLVAASKDLEWGAWTRVVPRGTMSLDVDVSGHYEPQSRRHVLLGMQNEPVEAVEGRVQVPNRIRRRLAVAQRFVQRWLGSIEDLSGQPFKVSPATRFLHALDALWLSWFPLGFERTGPLPHLRKYGAPVEWRAADFAFPNRDRVIAALRPTWLDMIENRRVTETWSPHVDDAHMLNFYFRMMLGLNVEVLTTERWPQPEATAELRIED